MTSRSEESKQKFFNIASQSIQKVFRLLELNAQKYPALLTCDIRELNTMNNDISIQLLNISGEIQDIVDDRDDMDNSDYQGAIEAQVMKAYCLGKKQNDN